MHRCVSTNPRHVTTDTVHVGDHHKTKRLDTHAAKLMHTSSCATEQLHHKTIAKLDTPELTTMFTNVVSQLWVSFRKDKNKL